MQKILIVDDDAHIREVVSFALGKAGFTVVTAENGRQALEKFQRERPALLVLDILMPELDGTEVCRQLRAQPSGRATPIIFLSSKDDEVDRIVGLELGGDDYLAKPFSPRELVARVRALLRRAGPQSQATEGARMAHGRLALDPELFKAWWGEQEVVLTLTEFGVLRTLLQRPGKVCTRDHLMDASYELHKIVSDRTIDSHVRRVRSKFAAIGADPIETVHGVGYKLGPCA
ncbi:MAG TPA: response regulator transcription factor [Nevskiaceae bacterium]|nr:response regulator transcription factor [Nevskiaceae bacterium]